MEEKVLQMSLKKKWFNMTKAGVKTEDYREITPYWIRRFIKGKYNTDFTINDLTQYLKESSDANGYIRLYGKRFDFNKMTLGYPKSTDTDRILHLEHKGIEIRTGNPYWGAEEGKIYFVVKHGLIL